MNLNSLNIALSHTVIYITFLRIVLPDIYRQILRQCSHLWCSCSCRSLVPRDSDESATAWYVCIHTCQTHTPSAFIHRISKSPLASSLDLRDLEESMLPHAWPCPPPDPEELFAFTDLYGPPRLLLSFQVQSGGDPLLAINQYQCLSIVLY